MKKRALSAIRLSVKKDETTSPERQEEANRTKIQQLGAELVGTASDLNVSASKVNPFDRPELGPWLRGRADEFDLIVWWRWDRAIRSMKDLNKLVEWAQKNEKKLVFCEGPGSDLDFDFTEGKAQRKGSLAMLIANIVAWAAEVESQNISDRVTGAQAYLRERGEWRGGMVPYGFEPARISGQDRGWTLVHSPETISVLYRIIGWVHERKSLLWIANKLNEEQVASPRDAWDLVKKRRRVEAGVAEDDAPSEPHTQRLWNTSSLKIILTSRSLLGETEFADKVVLDGEGRPIRRGTPVVKFSEFQEIQQALTDRAMEPKTKYEDPNPLLGIVYCARCGERYYMKQERQKGRVYTSLSCRSRHGGGRKSCGQPTLSMKYAVEAVSAIALTFFGQDKHMIRHFVPGSDRSEELAMWHERIKFLKEDWDAGLDTNRDEYLRRHQSYNEKIKEIGKDVVLPPRWEYVDTGKTYSEVWSTLDVHGRRQLLEDLGVSVYLGRGEGPAAHEALSNFGDENCASVRRSYVFDEVEVEGLLDGVTDGRIKKDFRIWFLQDQPQNVTEVLHSRS